MGWKETTLDYINATIDEKTQLIERCDSDIDRKGHEFVIERMCDLRSYIALELDARHTEEMNCIMFINALTGLIMSMENGKSTFKQDKEYQWCLHDGLRNLKPLLRKLVIR